MPTLLELTAKENPNAKSVFVRASPAPMPEPTPLRKRNRDVRLVAVIPAFGREQLLKKTVERLLQRQTVPLHAVIVVGDQEQKVVESSGGVFFKFPNNPLGQKWQYGIDRAKEIGATDILIMGSSDWISDDWCKRMIAEILNGYDLVGKKDVFFLDVRGKNTKRMIHWRGYGEKRRSEEPIGTGRVISNEILEKMNWACFDKGLNSSLDWSTYTLIRKASGNVKTIDTDKAYALSISCDKWGNKHNFDEESQSPTAINIKNPDETLKIWFPDAINIFG